jgi:hypothetical protein
MVCRICRLDSSQRRSERAPESTHRLQGGGLSAAALGRATSHRVSLLVAVSSQRSEGCDYSPCRLLAAAARPAPIASPAPAYIGMLSSKTPKRPPITSPRATKTSGLIFILSSSLPPRPCTSNPLSTQPTFHTKPSRWRRVGPARTLEGTCHGVHCLPTL